MVKGRKEDCDVRKEVEGKKDNSAVSKEEKGKRMDGRKTETYCKGGRICQVGRQRCVN